MTEMHPEDVEAEVEVEEEVRPDWLPDKFKQPEDLARSYRESENRIRELSDQARAQQAQIEHMIATQEAAQQERQQKQPDYGDDRWQEDFDRDPLRTSAYIAQQQAEAVFERRWRELQQTQQQQVEPLGATQAQLVAYQAEAQVSAKYDDWGDYKDRVRDAIGSGQIEAPADWYTSIDKTGRLLENAYKLVKADDLLEASRKAAGEQAQTARERKLGAQTMAGSSGARSASSEGDYHAIAKALHEGTSPYGSS